MKVKQVTLPFGEIIYQAAKGQGISNDIVELNKYLIESYSEKKIDILELGTGIGIIPAMILHYKKKWTFTGVEIQRKLVDIAVRNLKKYGNRARIVHYDLKQYKRDKRFDLIISNPPYFRKNEGRVSPNKIRAVSRHEIKCEMQDILENILRNLKKDGEALLIYPERREEELRKKLKKVDLILKKSLVVNLNSKKKERKLFVINYA